MRVYGNYFSEPKKMLDEVEQSLSSLSEREKKKVMVGIKIAMDDSAGRGINGENSCTSTIVSGGYTITANVCCGGHAEVSVNKVKTTQILS